jgi:HKD family nuclease
MDPNVQLVSNRGPNTTEAELKRILRQAKQADLAVAFVSLGGVNALIGQLNQIASKGHVRILTGLYQDVTDPAALMKLRNTERRLEGKLQVRISKTSHFHEKLYLAHHPTSLHILIGSSNLSQDGLSTLGELNISQQFPNSSSAARKFATEFEHLWAHESVPVTDMLIGLYTKRHKKLAKPHNPPGIPTFAEIIRAGKSWPKQRPKPPRASPATGGIQSPVS